MKTTSTKKTPLLIVLFAITMVSFSACNLGSKNSSEAGAEQVVEKTKTPSMDIHTAVLMDNLKAVEQHIKAGTDLNQKDQYGSTPLIVASTFGRTKAADALIKGGAKLNVTSADGSTPLHTAAFFCRTEIVKLLLEAGADKNLRNTYGSTPLESVTAPFSAVKPIYTQINKDLGPLGIRLDYEELEETRPIIADLLK